MNLLWINYYYDCQYTAAAGKLEPYVYPYAAQEREM